MIANLFFCLIASGFVAGAAARSRYERLWSFLLLAFLAFSGFYFWENWQQGITGNFAFHWIDASLMQVNINLASNTDTYRLTAPLFLLAGISVFYNTFYPAETEKLRLNGLLLLNLAALILLICAQNFMQLLTAVCIADVLCLFMINDIEGKRRYIFYNLLADMGLFTLFALIWKQTGSVDLAALSGFLLMVLLRSVMIRSLSATPTSRHYHGRESAPSVNGHSSSATKRGILHSRLAVRA